MNRIFTIPFIRRPRDGFPLMVWVCLGRKSAFVMWWSHHAPFFKLSTH
jgi:hypothetical protein